MARPSAEIVAKIPLFSDLEPRELKRIADSFKERQYTAGDTISSEGSSGAGFFAIGDGTAKVTVHGEERGSLGARAQAARRRSALIVSAAPNPRKRRR